MKYYNALSALRGLLEAAETLADAEKEMMKHHTDVEKIIKSHQELGLARNDFNAEIHAAREYLDYHERTK